MAGSMTFAQTIKTGLLWALGEIWEKINVVATWREIKGLVKKHGMRFAIAAGIWELIEDVLFPVLSYYGGVPELIPIFLIFHFEIVTWPIFFWAFRTYDRAKGREPWEPDRSVMSTHWRSLVKVVVYMMAASGWFLVFVVNMDRGYQMMMFFTSLMSVFGFVHERIWHDNNYGIRGDDTVEVKRTLAKTVTFRFVSFLVHYAAFSAFLPEIPWGSLLAYQACATVAYASLEGMWSRSRLGLEECVPASTSTKTGSEEPCLA